MLSHFGHVTGLELDDYARNHIPLLNGVDIYKGWLPDGLHSIRGKSFDFVCLLDVLEHIKHDEDSLILIKDFLKTKGKLLLTVPAYQWMFSVHDENIQHYRRYACRQLVLKCEKAGYKVVYSGYMNMLLLPMMIVARFVDRYVNKIKNMSSSTGSAIPPVWLNTVLYNLFAVESFWIPYIRTPAGSSVVVLAEK